MKLLFDALLKFTTGILLVMLLLFLPAGSFKYTGGWLFIAILFIPIFILGCILLICSPKLLEKRLDGKEKEATQRSVVAFSSLIFIVGFVIAGLDFRFGWTVVSRHITVIACVLFIFSYILYAEIMRENIYLSRTIMVEENQKVIDTGLYGIVRHPMYLTTIIMFLMIPIILGSWISFAVFCFYPIIISKRIINEEEFLTQHLVGYKEYKQKVEYRIIPFIW